MNEIIRDPLLLSPETKILWQKQQDIILIYRLPFKTFETFREDDRQAMLFKNGASQKEHSNHQDREAWDEVVWLNNSWSWEEKHIFWYQVLGILTLNLIKGLRWGADWNGKAYWFDERFKDFAHWERII